MNIIIFVVLFLEFKMAITWFFSLWDESLFRFSVFKMKQKSSKWLVNTDKKNEVKKKSV